MAGAWTPAAAFGAGYHSFTLSYLEPEERLALERQMADCRRSGVDFVLVRQGNGLSLWQRRKQAGGSGFD